jgi:beta-galactosidase
VKAAVYEQDRLLLEMQERFAADEGLYWGTEAAAALVISSGLQAEDASLAGGVVKSGGSGFHGAGYVDFDGREGHLEWYQENDGGERDVRLRIRYASGDSKSERPMSVTVNGRRLGAYNFPNTGDWSNVWQTVEIPARLRSGANRIRLQTTGQGGVNVDELQVTDVGASGQPAVKTGKLSAANY